MGKNNIIKNKYKYLIHRIYISKDILIVSIWIFYILVYSVDLLSYLFGCFIDAV